MSLQYTGPDRRLNIATAILDALSPEQLNERQRERERNRITLAELQCRVRSHYERFGIHDVRVQWSGKGVEICFGAGLSTFYRTSEEALRQVERFGGAVFVAPAAS